MTRYFLIDIRPDGLPVKLGPYESGQQQKDTARAMMARGAFVLWMDVSDRGETSVGIVLLTDGGERQKVRVEVQP